jgi:hypothetical protein
MGILSGIGAFMNWLFGSMLGHIVLWIVFLGLIIGGAKLFIVKHDSEVRQHAIEAYNKQQMLIVKQAQDEHNAKLKIIEDENNSLRAIITDRDTRVNQLEVQIQKKLKATPGAKNTASPYLKETFRQLKQFKDAQ